MQICKRVSVYLECQDNMPKMSKLRATLASTPPLVYNSINAAHKQHIRRLWYTGHVMVGPPFCISKAAHLDSPYNERAKQLLRQEQGIHY
jgi:hypothetical protein